MSCRVVRAVVAFAAAAVLTLGSAPGVLAAAGPVAEVGHPAVAAATQARDYCNPGDTSSVTVVVDRSGAGGGIDIRCSSGSTGQQALANAFGYSEIASQPGFVCQIEGTPAGDCQDTPPGSAYWSYWQAAPGGGWAYSSRGFGSSRVKPGGFEGWSFGSGGAPGIDPVLPAAPDPEPPAPAPEPAAPVPNAPAAPEPEQQGPAAGPEVDTPDNGSGEPINGADPTPDTATESAIVDGAADPAAVAAAEAAAAAAASQAAAAASQAAATAAAQAAAESAAAVAAQQAAAAELSGSASAAVSGPATNTGASTSAGGSSSLSSSAGTSGSTIWFSVVALLAVASLGTAAVVMSRRRRPGTGDDQAG